MTKHWGTALLTATLLCVLVSAIPSHYALWPVTCNQPPPPWLPQLIRLAKLQKQPGFQLALQPTNNRQPPLVCSAGFAGPKLWHGPLSPHHKLRYASLSKVMTAAAVLETAHEGHWQTADTLIQHLPLSGPWKDPRIAYITLEQLLSHTAGFDRSLTPDPMFISQPWCPNRLEALRTQQLDHAPGIHFAYANIGYCLLGAALQANRRLPLTEWFSQHWWAPWHLHTITAVKRGQWLPREPMPRFAPEESVEQLLHADYASLRSSGGWGGTAEDYNRWLHTALNMPYAAKLLSNPLGCSTQKWRHCHGLAFYQYQAQEHRPIMWWRDGSLPGATGFTAHLSTGESVTYLAHSRNVDWLPDNNALGLFFYDTLAQ